MAGAGRRGVGRGDGAAYAGAIVGSGKGGTAADQVDREHCVLRRGAWLEVGPLGVGHFPRLRYLQPLHSGVGQGRGNQRRRDPGVRRCEQDSRAKKDSKIPLPLLAWPPGRHPPPPPLGCCRQPGVVQTGAAGWSRSLCTLPPLRRARALYSSPCPPASAPVHCQGGAVTPPVDFFQRKHQCYMFASVCSSQEAE